MRIVLNILLLFICTLGYTQNPLSAIGQWRGHYDNHSIRHIVKGDAMYAASPYQIIKYDTANNPYWIDKSNGLHDININHLAWDALQEQLLVSYENSNIDIIKGDQVFNINAIELTSSLTNHSINAIRIYNNWALVATNFGIVVLDLIKHEIKDNWFPNNSQQATITYDVVLAKDSLFVATENGIWSTPFKNNWILPNQWKHAPSYDELNIQHLTQQNGIIYAYNNTTLFQLPNTSPIFNTNNGHIQNIDTTSSALNICIQYPSNKGAILQLNKDHNISTLIDSNEIAAPMQAIILGNNYWVADSINGLLLKNTSSKWLNAGGPKASIQGAAFINENNLLAPFGNKHIGFAKFSEDAWVTYSAIGNSILPNFNASIQSNQDQSFWFTSNVGLIHFTNNNTQVEYIQPNALTGSYNDIQSDQNNKLWVLQDQQGIARESNTTWNTIPLPSNFINKGLEKFILNNQGQAWLIAPNQQGIFVYQSKDVYATEIWRQLSTQSSNGNLPSMHVTSIAKDHAGSIWVGTDNGIAIYNCGDMASEPCNAYVPIVNNNGFNGYLFQHEIVNCIAVDGANRKWIGTNNGAWLLSEDGLNIIAHFTKTNSPLPADTILQILIAPTTGEVFINTSNQMVSYRGTATEGKQTQNNIQIFPNPVASSYNGTIAFRGLIENAILKITDLTGKLVYQTNALGGQAIWNGRTYEGRKIATGIYLVFARDLAGNENSVRKLVIADGY